MSVTYRVPSCSVCAGRAGPPAVPVGDALPAGPVCAGYGEGQHHTAGGGQGARAPAEDSRLDGEPAGREGLPGASPAHPLPDRRTGRGPEPGEAAVRRPIASGRV